MKGLSSARRRACIVVVVLASCLMVWATPAGAVDPSPGDLWSWSTLGGAQHDDDAFRDVAVAGAAGDVIYAAGCTDLDYGADAGSTLMARYAASGGMPTWTRAWRPLGATRADLTTVTTDNAGNVIAAGQTWDGTQYDIVVVKRDPNGDLVWWDVKDGGAHGSDSAADIVTDGAGNVYVCGTFDGWTKAVVLKYAAEPDPNGFQNGLLLWEKATRPSVTPGSAEAWGLAYAGGYLYFTGGRTTRTDQDCFLRKLARDGSTKWLRGWDGAGHRFDCGQAIAASTVAGMRTVYVAGGTETRTHSNDVFILRYSTSGRRVWARTWDGPTHGSDEVWNMTADGHGRPCVVGSTFVAGGNNKALLLTWTTGGAHRWTRTYRVDPNGQAAFAAVVAGGPIWVAGHADTPTTRDWVVARYSAGGTREWLTRWSGPPGDPHGGTLSACATFGADGLFVAGRVLTTTEGDDAAVGWLRR